MGMGAGCAGCVWACASARLKKNGGNLGRACPSPAVTPTGARPTRSGYQECYRVGCLARPSTYRTGEQSRITQSAHTASAHCGVSRGQSFPG